MAHLLGLRFQPLRVAAIDVLNLETGRFESPDIHKLLKEVGDDWPLLDKIVSINENGSLRKPRLWACRCPSATP